METCMLPDPVAMTSQRTQPSVLRRRRNAFTLIDALVVASIIGLISALLLPGIQRARETARRTQCRNNLNQIGSALHNYHDTHSVLPYGSTCNYPVHARFTTVKHAWPEFLLPHLSQNALYQQINFSISVDDGSNRALFQGKFLPVFACPSNPYSNLFTTRDGRFFSDWGVTDACPGAGPVQGLAYPMCAGSILPDRLPPDCTAGYRSYCVSESPSSLLSWWSPHSRPSPGLFNRGVTSIRLKDISDGASNTIAGGERNPEECTLAAVYSWNAPVFYTGQQLNSPTRTDNPVDIVRNCGSSSHHVGGGHFLFADGSVRFVASSIDFRLYCYLGDKADGNSVSVPE